MIRDDGVGLPVKADYAEGIGLHTMAYRARLIGGSLDARRHAQRGTVVTCAFPLREALDTSEDQDHSCDAS